MRKRKQEEGNIQDTAHWIRATDDTSKASRDAERKRQIEIAKKRLEILKKNTDRQIDIREKPYNPTIAKDHVGATVKIDKPTTHQGKIDWSQYFACVTYNSNTMVESFTNGVPVFCDGNNCAAKPIAETDFSKIETPKYEDRVALFSNLAYNNWTMEEMANGTAWRMLNEM